jgi:hypothetical protein
VLLVPPLQLDVSSGRGGRSRKEERGAGNKITTTTITEGVQL